jgi:hypothetical protein
MEQNGFSAPFLRHLRLIMHRRGITAPVFYIGNFLFYLLGLSQADT